MCGPQTPRPSQPLGGALAVLNAPSPSSSSSGAALSGHMIFHTLPGPSTSPSTMATHMTYTPFYTSTSSADEHPLDGCVVGIHSTGDMRTMTGHDDLLHRLDFRTSLFGRARSSAGFPLDEPLEIGVGGDGIIGRKVSVWRDFGNGRGVRVAEGIVGFN
ncbi:hypothetical protein BJ166DRAFT_250140 [Pestalotiopsis sp. NC0098]|nr:hypothetical protein BJ166DRAFT_250140 [Pestalotiopsis sp. NC0098]